MSSGDRRSNVAPWVTIGIAATVQTLAAIWWMSSLNTTVAFYGTKLDRIETILERLTAASIEQNKRLEFLEARGK